MKECVSDQARRTEVGGVKVRREDNYFYESKEGTVRIVGSYEGVERGRTGSRKGSTEGKEGRCGSGER